MYSTINDHLKVIQQVKTYKNENSDLELQASYDYCMDIMKVNSKSFYFAAQSLPQDKRYGVGALYAFCRLVDDIVDESGKRQEVKLQKMLYCMHLEIPYANFTFRYIIFMN